MRKPSEFIESGQAVSMSQAKRLKAQGAKPRVPRGAFRGAVSVNDGLLIQKSAPFTNQTWVPHTGEALAFRWSVQTATNLQRAGNKVDRVWIEEFTASGWTVVEGE